MKSKPERSKSSFLFHIVLDLRAMKKSESERTQPGREFHTSSGCVPKAEAMAATSRFHPSVSCRKRLRPAAVNS